MGNGVRIDAKLVACFWGCLVGGMVGCRPVPVPQPETPVPIATPAPQTSPSAADKPSSLPQPTRRVAIASPSPAAGKQVVVNIYAADGQCLKLVPVRVGVDAKKSLEAAIAKILANNDSADFSVSRHWVTVRNGVATVDLQPAGTRRSLRSLSTCEQLSLFGSIQKTLTSNPRWQIRSVRFTQKGKAIAFE